MNIIIFIIIYVYIYMYYQLYLAWKKQKDINKIIK
jgi:hypothetical protein